MQRAAPLLLLAAASTSHTSLAHADGPATPAAAASPESATPAPEAHDGEHALRYRVVVDAPANLRAVLAASVDLVRWESYAEMTSELFAELVRVAPEQAKEAVATEGHFSAAVTITIDRASNPVVVTLRVEAGAVALVDAVDLVVTGPARSDPAAHATIQALRRGWSLPRGSPFTQTAWQDAKSRAIATMTAGPYAAAKIAVSEARVDAATNRATLSMTIDSGPPFRFGALDIQGLKRYRPDMVRHYASFAPGDPWSRVALDQFVRRLNGSGYFASVQATLDNDPARADAAPVHVLVIEGPPKRVEAGIGFSTDTAFRGNLSYRDVNFASHAIQMRIDLDLESKVQSGSIRFVTPPAANGWSTSTFASIEGTDIAGLVTQTGTAGLRMISQDERNQWQYGAAMYNDEQHPADAEAESSRALFVDAERAWRRVDDLISPTRGYSALLGVGAGIPGVSTRGFERVVGHLAAWWPLSRDWSAYFRAEGGAVIAESRDGVPSPLLFRTGGDTTVRGYAFESLGVREGNAVVPGRYYGAASVEVTRWLNPTLGIATFVDAGNAFDRMADLRAAVGYGIGARVRTPIGPFRLDVAYGEQSKQIRLHFSVGLTF
ncbi:MAG: autotransporter assembly complex protein TamA [Casimicrobiaceae bacterium]